jgi:hypothetical protein
LGLSTVTSPVVSDFRRGGLKGFLERSLSPEVMLTRSSLDVPPAEKAVHSWAPTQEPLAVSTSLGGGSGDLSKLDTFCHWGWGFKSERACLVSGGHASVRDRC